MRKVETYYPTNTISKCIKGLYQSTDLCASPSRHFAHAPKPISTEGLLRSSFLLHTFKRVPLFSFCDQKKFYLLRKLFGPEIESGTREPFPIHYQRFHLIREKFSRIIRISFREEGSWLGGELEETTSNHTAPKLSPSSKRNLAGGASK